jgi:choline dehydrogenase
VHGANTSVPHALAEPQTPYHQLLKQRQAGGEWRVDKQRLRWDVLEAFAQAAVQAGIPASTDFNTGDNHGVGYFEVNQK